MYASKHVDRDRFAAFADVIKVSDEDLGLIYPGATAAEIAGRWLRAGAGLVIVTRGESGAEAFMPQTEISVAGHRVALVDTVGAGDTFQAAVIAGLAELGIWSRSALKNLSPDTLARVLEFAAHAAAITCSRRGADLPRRAELPSLSNGAPGR